MCWVGQVKHSGALYLILWLPSPNILFYFSLFLSLAHKRIIICYPSYYLSTSLLLYSFLHIPLYLVWLHHFYFPIFFTQTFCILVFPHIFLSPIFCLSFNLFLWSLLPQWVHWLAETYRWSGLLTRNWTSLSILIYHFLPWVTLTSYMFQQTSTLDNSVFTYRYFQNCLIQITSNCGVLSLASPVLIDHLLLTHLPDRSVAIQKPPPVYLWPYSVTDILFVFSISLFSRQLKTFHYLILRKDH